MPHPMSPQSPTPTLLSSSRGSSFLVEYDYDEPKPAKKLLAKAIYDNIAESTDELAFRKGDILTVIETDTSDLKGWWLCQLRGRQGICPGNRLKIIQPHDSGCFTLSPASSPCPSIGPGTNLNSPIPSEIYENTSTASSISYGGGGGGGPKNHQTTPQQQGKRRSWHINPNKVLTPQKCGDVYLYDLLPTPTRGNSPYQQQPHSYPTPDALDTYDVPKPAVPINYDTPRAWSRTPPHYSHHHHYPSPHSPHTPNLLHQQHPGHLHFNYRMEESYDVPRPVNNLLAQQNLTPSSSNSSLLTSDSLSLSSSNRSSLANMPD